MDGYKVFISHTNSQADLEIVERVAAELGSIGIYAYIAERDRQLGVYLTDKIKANIRDSDLVVGIWTKMAEGSAYVNNELGYAEDRKSWYLLFEKGATVTGFAVGREYLEFDRASLDESLISLVSDVLARREEKRISGENAILFFGALAAVLAGITAAYLTSTKK